MIRDADLPPSHMFNAFGAWYSTTQFVAIRRLVDDRKDVDSLVRLIRDVARMPSHIDRATHVGVAAKDDTDGYWTAVANKSFDEFAGEGRDVIPKAAFQADIDDLRSALNAITKFANARIAHRTRIDEATPVPTFGEIDEAANTLANVTNRYLGLLKGTQMIMWEPVMKGDWAAPFRVGPWLSPR